MKIVVVEDEVAAYNNIERLVRNSKIEPITVIAWLKSIEETEKWLIINGEPDLLLLDIQLSDGLVFELFVNMEINCSIVFTTAFDHYAIKAFDYNALSYLLKPISQSQFDEMIKKVIQNNSTYKVNQSLLSLITQLDAYNSKSTTRERFLLKKGDKYFVVKTSNICYVYLNPSVIIETFEGERFIVGGTLDELINQLDPKKFFRCNRQVAVNIDSVITVIPYFKNSLLLKLKRESDFEIVIPKDKVRAFKLWMDR